MAINIIIKNMKKTDDLEVPNTVTEITYSITKELNGKTASVDGFAGLDISQLTEENFIPLSELTETIVKDWVLNCISDRINSIEQYLDTELTPQEEKTKIVSTEIKLPWETN
jgi:hypothetical protein